jgi:putative DNA primase/helicase
LSPVNATDIEAVPVEWLWKDWLALGKIHPLAGAPGTGKTTIALDFAASVTSGRKWPNGTTINEPSDVLMWSADDDTADSLVPRFILNCGDLNRMKFIQGVTEDGLKRPFNPALDIAPLCEAIKKLPRLKLLIVDPIVLGIAGDSHKNAEVRRGLQPLVDLAARAPLNL